MSTFSTDEGRFIIFTGAFDELVPAVIKSRYIVAIGGNCLILVALAVHLNISVMCKLVYLGENEFLFEFIEYLP